MPFVQPVFEYLIQIWSDAIHVLSFRGQRLVVGVDEGDVPRQVFGSDAPSRIRSALFMRCSCNVCKASTLSPAGRASRRSDLLNHVPDEVPPQHHETGETTATVKTRFPAHAKPAVRELSAGMHHNTHNRGRNEIENSQISARSLC